MKATHFSISVPEPCTENWAQMTPCERGRFCGSCQKTVIDFTGYSDAELAAFFSRKENKNTCGRFYAHQIENKVFSYTAPVKKPYRTLAMAASVAALTVMSFAANAQVSNKNPKHTNTPLLHDTPHRSNTSKNKQTKPLLNTNQTEPAELQILDRNTQLAETHFEPLKLRDSIIPSRRNDLVIGGGRVSEATLIVIEGTQSATPKTPSLQDPGVKTYTGKEWQRMSRMARELAEQQR